MSKRCIQWLHHWFWPLQPWGSKWNYWISWSWISCYEEGSQCVAAGTTKKDWWWSCNHDPDYLHFVILGIEVSRTLRHKRVSKSD